MSASQLSRRPRVRPSHRRRRLRLRGRCRRRGDLARCPRNEGQPAVSSLAKAVLFEPISESADQGSAATVVTWYVVHKIFDKNGRLSRDRPPGYSSTETWEEIESRSADAGSGLASIQRFARAGRRWVGGMKQEGAPFCWRKRWMLRERRAYARVRCAWP